MALLERIIAERNKCRNRGDKPERLYLSPALYAELLALPVYADPDMDVTRLHGMDIHVIDRPDVLLVGSNSEN